MNKLKKPICRTMKLLQERIERSVQEVDDQIQGMAAGDIAHAVKEINSFRLVQTCRRFTFLYNFYLHICMYKI